MCSIFFAVFFVLLQATLVRLEEPPFKSEYACQGSKARLRCKAGSSTVIEILNANYGRTQSGSAVCPHKNATNTRCVGKQAFAKIPKKCNGKPRCNVIIDETFFTEDPCPGTFKYLHVIFRCVPAPSTPPTPPRETTKTVNNTTTKATSTRTYGDGRQRTSTKPPMNATLSPAIESNKGYVHRERPKYVLIIFLSGVAAATVLLLILLIALNFLGKRKKEKKYQLELKAAAKELEQLEDEDEDEGQNDDVEDDDEGEHKKTVTIEIQGGDNETKQISVNPGDIIIIDSKDVDNDDSEDLGYMSEIVRYYNSRNNGNDDGISIRKQSLTCETPSVLSIPNSEGDKREEYETLRMTSVGNGAIPDGPPIVNGSCVS